MAILDHSRSVGAKAFVVGVIVLLLLIPLTMLRGLVNERSSLRAAAYRKVAAGWGGRVTVPGPILVVPSQRTITREGKTTLCTLDVLFLPTDLTYAIDLRMQDERRRIGIYEVPVYVADVKVTGHLDREALRRWQQVHPEHRLLWNHARVQLPLWQTRELRGVAGVYAGQPLRFVPAAASEPRGIEAALAWMEAPAERVDFELHLLLAGSEGLSILPLGSTTRATMTGNWPHPSFSGAFAPTRYQIDSRKFSAEWSVLELNRSYGNAWLRGEVGANDLLQSATGVDIFQSVDIYQRGDRAIKYALVFIALTFLTFFAWEQVSNVRLHPLQYLLLGLALSVFYLLLVALTEHLSFGIAYTVAAGALVLLLGTYTASALRSVRRGLAVAGAIGATYGFLYGLVIAEDYALLMGAIAVFVALAIVMLVTRRIDWYGRAADV